MMECQATGREVKKIRVVNRCGAVLTLILGLAGSLPAQNLIDKSAPNDRNTDLQFDFSVTNTGKRGIYRVIRPDTGETLVTGLVGQDISARTTLLKLGVRFRTEKYVVAYFSFGSEAKQSARGIRLGARAARNDDK
jgi:hypothetical protein